MAAASSHPTYFLTAPPPPLLSQKEATLEPRAIVILTMSQQDWDISFFDCVSLY